MSFLKSIFFWSPGSYHILGMEVAFTNDPSGNVPALDGCGPISNITYKALHSEALRWVTQGYMHVFVHEMGHALACKLLTDQNPTVRFFKSTLEGKTSAPCDLTDWKKTVIEMAGCVMDIAFASCKLMAATALKNYLPFPIRLVLGGGGVVWISGELFYAYISASKKDGNDFGSIACRSHTHLAFASMALIGEVALGIFMAIKLAA